MLVLHLTCYNCNRHFSNQPCIWRRICDAGMAAGVADLNFKSRMDMNLCCFSLCKDVKGRGGLNNVLDLIISDETCIIIFQLLLEGLSSGLHLWEFEYLMSCSVWFVACISAPSCKSICVKATSSSGEPMCRMENFCQRGCRGVLPWVSFALTVGPVWETDWYEI
jgi:hypothetical protein